MKKDVYCANCGTKNKINNKKCTKCNKKLNSKLAFFKSFMSDYIKDDLKSNLGDSLVDILKNYIISHLYGIGFLASTIFAVVTVVNYEFEYKDIKKELASVTKTSEVFKISNNKNNTVEEPVIKDIETNEVKNETVKEEKQKTTKKESTKVEKKTTTKKKETTTKETTTTLDYCDSSYIKDKVKTCENDFSLNNDTCIKTTSVNATKHTSCDDGYTLTNDKCVSDSTKEYDEIISCSGENKTLRGYVLEPERIAKVYKSGNKCYADVCDVSTTSSGYDCNNTYQMELEPTITRKCDGYVSSDGLCHSTKSVNVSYTCDSGTLDGTKCISTETKSYTLECPSGYTFNTKCNACRKEE